MSAALDRPVTVTIEPRPDGGIRVWSAELPGLVLSSTRVDGVMLDILPAVRVIREHAAAIRKGEA